jgi:hypothetical protein
LRPQSGHRRSRATGAQKIVVASSLMAASVIVTPNSMVRMIVSATTEGEQAVAFDKGHLGGVGEALRNLTHYRWRSLLHSGALHALVNAL